MEELIRKLQSLFDSYEVSDDDITRELLNFSLALAKEFVRGFNVVKYDERTKPSNRPKTIMQWDWLELFKLVDEYTAKGQTINQACKSIIAKQPNWSRYKYISLAATYRREANKVKVLVENETNKGKSKYFSDIVREMFEARMATSDIVVTPRSKTLSNGCLPMGERVPHLSSLTRLISTLNDF